MTTETSWTQDAWVEGTRATVPKELSLYLAVTLGERASVAWVEAYWSIWVPRFHGNTGFSGDVK